MKRLAVLVCALAALLVASVGCEPDYINPGPPPCVPVDVAGVWDVRWVQDQDLQCPINERHVWTIHQNGCEVSVESDSSDTLNGSAGYAGDGYFAVGRTWDWDCHEFEETINVPHVDGDTMTGDYTYVMRRLEYTNCSPLVICTAAFSGVRRTQANAAR